MDIISIIALLLCISSPIFFLVALALGLLLFREHRNSLKTIRHLESGITTLSSNALIGIREQWFTEVANINYNSELEVEAKFIYLFVRFLGYSANDLRARVSIQVQVGRQKVSGIADWVVYDPNTNRPFLVIEAKEPNQMLNNIVQGQARSYAYGLNATFYMITNGREIQIYERKIDNDVLVISFGVREIVENWGKMEQLIGKK
jgi:hypothetical protein